MESDSEAVGSQLESHLQTLIENVRQINVMVQDFQPNVQPILNHKIQSIITNLQQIDKAKELVRDVKIPLEVLDHIDKGKNPQVFTKDCLINALAKNEEFKGKVEGYKTFKARLLYELTQSFPSEMEKYRAFRELVDQD